MVVVQVAESQAHEDDKHTGDVAVAALRVAQSLATTDSVVAAMVTQR